MSLRAGLLRQRCLVGPSGNVPRLLRPRVSTNYGWPCRAYSTPGKHTPTDSASTPTPMTAGSASTPPFQPAATTTQSAASTSAHNGGAEHNHSHAHGEEHSHSGIFHSHDHSHSHSEGAEQLMEAIRTGRMDRGTKITLLGLGSNVALTVSKGVAGLWMNSASLLAEAGHSLSDLLGDFVTLATWRISRKAPDDRFPWGYAKFETCGTLAVSVILVGGAIGIGLHSYHLLLQTLLPWLESLPSDSMFAGLQAYLPNSVPSPLLEMFHSHGVSGHEHAHALEGEASGHAHAATNILNPHAAWFALASVLVKEWLYRLTDNVAKQEHSPVLRANALHHRADALTSLVALGSILGSSFGGYAWLDPVGGIAVSFFILQQGVSLSAVACKEFLDVGISPTKKASIIDLVQSTCIPGLKGCRNVRGVRSGGQIMLDLTLVVPAHMSVMESHEIEMKVRRNLLDQDKEIREVKVHVHADSIPEEAGEVGPSAHGTNNDFSKQGCGEE